MNLKLKICGSAALLLIVGLVGSLMLSSVETRVSAPEPLDAMAGTSLDVEEACEDWSTSDRHERVELCAEFTVGDEYRQDCLAARVDPMVCKCAASHVVRVIRDGARRPDTLWDAYPEYVEACERMAVALDLE